jgi:hypothetical protein
MSKEEHADSLADYQRNSARSTQGQSESTFAVKVQEGERPLEFHALLL